jgi:uroporphyrinogen decarboxylase
MAGIDNNLLRVLRGENTGRVPFWEVWFQKDDALGRQIMGGPVDTIAREVALAQRLGWEHLRIGGVSDGLPRAYAPVHGGRERYSPEGALFSLAQLEEMPPLDLDQVAEFVGPRIRAANEAGLAAICYVPWCFHSTATAMGLLNFAYKTVDDIDFVHTVFEFVEERVRLALREVILPLGADAVLFDGDCAYRSGLMVSPRVFKELIFDRTARTVAPLAAAGIPYIFHSDGKLDDVIPLLIELGFAAVHGIEALANDLADIKARFGRRITIMGNMDITFLGYATEDDVVAATQRMLDIGARGGRYVAACNTSPEDFIPLGNYLAFVETILGYIPHSPSS